MAYAFTAETLLLVLVVLLVAGLLRSHAEILRRLEAIGDRSGEPGTFDVIGTPSSRDGAVPAPEIRGERVDRQAVAVTFSPGGASTLVAFLSTGCSLCMDFWTEFQRPETLGPPAGLRLLIVTKARELESPSEVERLSPRAVPVIMSTEAWTDYEVSVAPSFAFIDGATASIRGEGSARSWTQLRDLLRTALADAQHDDNGSRGARRVETPAERDARADRALAAAGIKPEDPEFYAAPYYGPATTRQAD
jgi:hypothetical protein